MSNDDPQDKKEQLDRLMMPERDQLILEWLERLSERMTAHEAATQKRVDFILDQQAQLTATVGSLAESVTRLAAKVDRTADATANLLTITEMHDKELSDTDERLSALINTVERYISEGRNGEAKK